MLNLVTLTLNAANKLLGIFYPAICGILVLRYCHIVAVYSWAHEKDGGAECRTQGRQGDGEHKCKEAVRGRCDCATMQPPLTYIIVGHFLSVVDAIRVLHQGVTQRSVRWVAAGLVSVGTNTVRRVPQRSVQWVVGAGKLWALAPLWGV